MSSRFSRSESRQEFEHRHQLFQRPAAVLGQFLWLDCNGRIHRGEQYLRIFIHFSQLCDAGVHELYQPELRRGKNEADGPRFNRLSDFILCVFPDHGCCAWFFGPQLLQIYTESSAVISCGVEILSFTTVTYFLCGIMDLIPGALRGMGRSAVPMILSIIGTVGTRIVWIFWIFPYHRSLDILFLSYPVSGF